MQLGARDNATGAHPLSPAVKVFMRQREPGHTPGLPVLLL